MDNEKQEQPKEKVDFVNSCISCKFFDLKNKWCNEHRFKTFPTTPKCNSWRYFA